MTCDVRLVMRGFFLPHLNFSNSARNDGTCIGAQDGGGSNSSSICKKEVFASSGSLLLEALSKSRGTAEQPFVIDDDDDDGVAVDLNTFSKAAAY